MSTNQGQRERQALSELSQCLWLCDIAAKFDRRQTGLLPRAGAAAAARSAGRGVRTDIERMKPLFEQLVFKHLPEEVLERSNTWPEEVLEQLF